MTGLLFFRKSFIGFTRITFLSWVMSNLTSSVAIAGFPSESYSPTNISKSVCDCALIILGYTKTFKLSGLIDIIFMFETLLAFVPLIVALMNAFPVLSFVIIVHNA